MLTKAQWLRKKRRKRIIKLCILTSIVIFILGIVLFLIISVFHSGFLNLVKTKSVSQPKIMEMFLTPNEYSRPQIPLNKVKSIVIHYTANPGTDALANRNYFENLKDSQTTYASSHFVIGLDGTIIQCIPLDEVSYASNDRNYDAISIECTHPDTTGQFNQETVDSLIALTAWLCGKFNLKEDDIIRHYDVTGKKCPLYYVEHEDQWELLKDDVMEYINNNAINK